MNAMQDMGKPLPSTIEETSDEISNLAGEIVAIQNAIDLHHERQKAGFPVDHGWWVRAKTKLGYMRGELSTLHSHRKALAWEQRRLDKIAAKEKTAANLARQAEINAQAARAKADRKAINIARTALQDRAALEAIKQFIANNWPDRLHEAWDVIANACAQVDATMSPQPSTPAQPRSGPPEGQVASPGSPHSQTQQEATE